MSLWSRYVRLLETRPVVTKSVTSAALYVLGDGLAQKLDGTIDRKGYDTVRARTALIWGGILFAPAAHVWYNRVLNPFFPGSGARAVAAKMILDQTVWALPCNAAYLFASSMLSGKSVDQAKEVVSGALVDVMKVPVINVAILGWSCFLAVKANEGDEKNASIATANTKGTAPGTAGDVATGAHVVVAHAKK